MEINSEVIRNFFERSDEIIPILERLQRNCEEGIKACNKAVELLKENGGEEKLAF